MERSALGMAIRRIGDEGGVPSGCRCAGATTVVDTSKYAARALGVSSLDARLVWLRQEPESLLARLLRPRRHGRTFGLFTAVAYLLWVGLLDASVQTCSGDRGQDGGAFR